MLERCPMNVNTIDSSVPFYPARQWAKLSPDLAPRDTFQSVASNAAPRVNVKDAVAAIFGGGCSLKELWKTKVSEAEAMDNGIYRGPVPFKSSTSLFMGDKKSYKRIDQKTGLTEWEFKLKNGEEFVCCRPVVTKDNLICIRYQFQDGQIKDRKGLCVIDAKNGKEIVRYNGRDEIYDEIETDGKGNIYFATVCTQKLIRMSPGGEMKVLNKPEQGKDEFLCAMKVTSDGTVYYPMLNSDTMVRIRHGREKRFTVDGTIDKFYPLENGQIIVKSYKYKDPDCNQVVTCFDARGEKTWEKRLKETSSDIATAPDGRAYIMHFGNWMKFAPKAPCAVECIAPDGTQQWSFEFKDPQISDSTPWSYGTLRVGPQGELVILGKNEGHALCLNPDGTEKWRFIPDGYIARPQYSFTHDNKLYMLHGGSMEKLDLTTGKREIEYSAYGKTFTRYGENGESKAVLLKDENVVHFQGLVLQNDEDHVFSFDDRGNFCAYELPGADDGEDEEESGNPVSAIEVIDDFVNIGGVILPVNK
jgi:outer membrane protein assembly factor BamB